jgi:hypothetical protein
LKVASILAEAFQRIERASEHLAELEIELLRFEKFKFTKELIFGLPEEEESTNAKLFASFERRNLPKPELPDVTGRARILVGEVAYNLVASLDYLVFVLARYDSGIEQKGTQFPVCAKPELFERGRFTLLKGVSKEHVALINRLQPYNGCTWTKRLKELCNVDKHRKLIQVRARKLEMMGVDPEMRGARHETTKEARARRRAGLPKPEAPMKVHLGEILTVTLDDGSPVIKALEILKSQVADVLVQFDSLLSFPG